MEHVVAFVAVAAILSVTPGVATALVVRSALRGGRREALLVIAGNSVGVLAWAVLSAVGVAAVVAASQVAFEALNWPARRCWSCSACRRCSARAAARRSRSASRGRTAPRSATPW